MQKFKTWVAAARPRTLPLSIAGILAGTGMALREAIFDWQIFVFALLTTLGFQILSNFANDYGDGIKGTDNAERLGPTRALQSGIITDKEMKRAMIWTAFITLIFMVVLILSAFDRTEWGYVFLFLILGLLAITAAIKYTVGKTAYGYHGLGDVFVFAFFGLLGVAGSYFLYAHQLNHQVWFPAIIVGLLSTTVLNLNNMRDRLSDKKAGKITLAVRLGKTLVKYYHSFLVSAAFILTIIYTLIDQQLTTKLIYVPFIFLALHLVKVWQNKHPKDLDPEMKKVALSTVLFALLFLGTGFF